jgi:hypothetical protein
MKTMSKIKVLAIVSLACFFAGCPATCSPPTPGPVPPADGGTFTDCAGAALHQTEVDILPAVENALASSNWESALISIATQLGGPLALEEVACVVAWVEAKAEQQAQLTADSLEATKAVHAKAWQAKHPANITGTASL